MTAQKARASLLILLAWWAAAPALAAAHGVRVPFTLRGHLVILDVWVDSAGPLPFVLDTGSSISAVSAETAVRLDLRPTGRRDVLTHTHRSVGVPVVRLGTIRIAAVPLRSVHALVVPSLPAASAGHGASGILGMDAFGGHGLFIDYRAQVIEFDTDPMFGRRFAGEPVAIDAVDGRLVVEVEAADQGHCQSLRLALDSGARSVTVFEGGESPLGALLRERRGRKVKLSSLLGVRVARQVLVGELSIGQRVLRDVEVTLAPGPAAWTQRQQHGLLPTSLFDAVLIDTHRAVVIFNAQPIKDMVDKADRP